MKADSDGRGEPFRAANEVLGIEVEDPRDIRFPELIPGLEPNDVGDMSIEVLSIGANKVLAVDNFFRDPHKTRAYAATLKYRPDKVAIAGVRANYESADYYLSDHIEDLCARLILKHLLGIEGTPVRFLTNNMAIGERAFTCTAMGREEAKRIAASAGDSPFHSALLAIGAPHVDSTRVWYSLIVHLTLPGNNPGGTALFRHRETGLQSFFLYDCVLAARIEEAFETSEFSKMLEVLRARDELTLDDAYTAIRGALPVEDWFRDEDNEYWECIGRMPGVFNRAYLFPAWQFHAEYMDNDAVDVSCFENTRLTFNLFVKPHAVFDEEA